MSPMRKRVVRFDVWIDPAFDTRLRAEPDIDLAVGVRAGPEADLAALIKSAHVLHASPARDELGQRWHVNTALLRQCPNLICASSAGAGYDTINVADCTAAGVAVVNQAGGNAQSVAELAIGLMLAVSRKITMSDRWLRTRRGFSREDLMGRELRGQRLGVVGIGHTGSKTAALARAFGMTVAAFDPLVAPDTIRDRGAEPVDLATLLKTSDIVSLHCPLDDTTRGLINTAAFAAMKPGAMFISTARGGIHDERALYSALTSGRIAGAGLDVWSPEPPPLNNPLLTLDTVVASYHTAGVTVEARRNMAAIAADQIVQILKGERPPRLLNPEIWPETLKRLRTLSAH